MAQYNTDTSYVPKGSPTNLDSLDWDSLDYNDLSQKQMKALQSLGGVGTKWAAPGTSGYTGSDIQAAGDIAEEAPTSLETGYGPQEQNPQQAYQTRFQQRSGTGEGYDAPTEYEGLSSQIGVGNYLQGRSAPTPTDYGAGEGAASGYDLGDPTLGQQLSEGFYDRGIAADPFSVGLSQTAPAGMMTQQMGYGFGPGLSHGIRSLMSSPAALLNMFDRPIGLALAQSELDKDVSGTGLTSDNVQDVQSGARTGALSGLTPQEISAVEALTKFQSSSKRATGRGLRSFGDYMGLTDEDTGESFDTEMATRDAYSALEDRDVQSIGMSLDLGRQLDAFSASPEETALDDPTAMRERSFSQMDLAAIQREQEQAAIRSNIEAAMADTFGTSVTGLESTFGDPFGIMGSTWGGGGIAGGTSRGDIGSGFGPSAAADVDREEGRGGSRGGGMGDIGF